MTNAIHFALTNFSLLKTFTKLLRADFYEPLGTVKANALLTYHNKH